MVRLSSSLLGISIRAPATVAISCGAGDDGIALNRQASALRLRRGLIPALRMRTSTSPRGLLPLRPLIAASCSYVAWVAR